MIEEFKLGERCKMYPENIDVYHVKPDKCKIKQRSLDNWFDSKKEID